MSNTRNTTAGIAAEIAKGWQPNNYLTNIPNAKHSIICIFFITVSFLVNSINVYRTL